METSKDMSFIWGANIYLITPLPAREGIADRYLIKKSSLGVGLEHNSESCMVYANELKWASVGEVKTLAERGIFLYLVGKDLEINQMPENSIPLIRVSPKKFVEMLELRHEHNQQLIDAYLPKPNSTS